MSGASFARRHLSRISTRDYIAVAVTALYFLGHPAFCALWEFNRDDERDFREVNGTVMIKSTWTTRVAVIS